MSAAYTRDTPIWRIGETKCIVSPMRVLGQPRRRGGIGAFTGRRSRRRDPGGIDRRIPALVVIEAGSCTRSLRSSEHGDAGTALALAGVQADPATVAAARVRARLRLPDRDASRRIAAARRLAVGVAGALTGAAVGRIRGAGFRGTAGVVGILRRETAGVGRRVDSCVARSGLGWRAGVVGAGCR